MKGLLSVARLPPANGLVVLLSVSVCRQRAMASSAFVVPLRLAVHATPDEKLRANLLVDVPQGCPVAVRPVARRLRRSGQGSADEQRRRKDDLSGHMAYLEW